MRSAITVSLVPQAKGGPFVFWEGLEDACERASALGFDAVEIFPPECDALDVPAVQALLARHRLAVAAVGTGGGWVRNKWTLTHADPQVRTDAREFIRDLISRAGKLQAPAILGSMQGRSEGEVSREMALAWLAEALEDLADFAAHKGQPFLFEALNRYETNLFNRQADAAAWLKTIDAPNVRLLCDLFHMNIEEVDSAATLREVGSMVGHVHFADSNRCAMGMGHTDAGAIVAALREIGYKGYLSAEILPLPDSAAAARQTMESFRRVVGG